VGQRAGISHSVVAPSVPALTQSHVQGENEKVFFFLKDFIYLFDRDRDSESRNTSRGSGRGRAGFLPRREPDVGLDPKTLGS